MFSLTLSQEGAIILDQAFREGAMPVGVIYDLKYTALRPALDVEITANFKRIYDHLSFGVDLTAGAVIYGVPVYLEAGIDMAFEKLKQDGVISIKVINYSDAADESDKEQWALDFFKQNLLQQWFQPTLAPITFDKKPPAGTGTAGTGTATPGTGTATPGTGTGTATPGTGTATPGTGTATPGTGTATAGHRHGHAGHRHARAPARRTAGHRHGHAGHRHGHPRHRHRGHRHGEPGHRHRHPGHRHGYPRHRHRGARRRGVAPPRVGVGRDGLGRSGPTRFLEAAGRQPARLERRVEPDIPGYDVQMTQVGDSDRVTLMFLGGTQPPTVRVNGAVITLTERQFTFDVAGGASAPVEADYPAEASAPQEFRLQFDFDKPRAAGWATSPPSATYTGYLTNRTNPLDNAFQTSIEPGRRDGARCRGAARLAQQRAGLTAPGEHRGARELRGRRRHRLAQPSPDAASGRRGGRHHRHRTPR